MVRPRTHSRLRQNAAAFTFQKNSRHSQIKGAPNLDLAQTPPMNLRKMLIYKYVIDYFLISIDIVVFS